MSRYGLPSRKMLTFLNENPGSTAREIHDHLHGGKTIEQLKVSYWTKHYTSAGDQWQESIQWQSKKYVLDYMLQSKYYRDVEVLDARVRQVSKICRGKFAYLTSPYNNRTLAADPNGQRAHPGAANKNGQRRWFWRTKHNGVYKYFITTAGMAAVEEHGLV